MGGLLLTLLLCIVATVSGEKQNFTRTNPDEISGAFWVYQGIDYKGGSKFLVAEHACHHIPYEWSNRISSIDPLNSCIKAYSDPNCLGRFELFKRGSPHQDNLPKLNFDDVMASYILC